MSARRHSIAAPSAGRLAAVLGVGRVATGAPGGQDESDQESDSDVEVDERLRNEIHSELTRIHEPHLDKCPPHFEDAWPLIWEQVANSLARVEDGKAAVADPQAVSKNMELVRVFMEIVYQDQRDVFTSTLGPTLDVFNRHAGDDDEQR